MSDNLTDFGMLDDAGRAPLEQLARAFGAEISYTAEVGGRNWTSVPPVTVASIDAARAYAEEYGTTADWCVIRDVTGLVVATHVRDQSGRGLDWLAVPI